MKDISPSVWRGNIETSTTSESYIFREVVCMKVIAVININGKEVDFESLTAEEKVKIANELNRRALGALGYQPVQKMKDETA